MRGHGDPGAKIGAPQLHRAFRAGEQREIGAGGLGPQPRLPFFAREAHQHRQCGSGGDQQTLAYCVMAEAHGEVSGDIGQRQALAARAWQQGGGGDADRAARLGKGQSDIRACLFVRQFQRIEQREDRDAGPAICAQIMQGDGIDDQLAVGEKGRKGEPVSGLTGALRSGVIAEQPIEQAVLLRPNRGSVSANQTGCAQEQGQPSQWPERVAGHG